jgi:zinc transport system substrate-binding protein
MKKIFLIIFIFMLVGCTPDEQDSDKINIVTTIFPSYDWVREIVGGEIDNFNLNYLTNSGVDLHSYAPSVPDILRIASSDVFIYVGGHSDSWVNAVLRDANPDLITINLMNLLDGFLVEDEHGCGPDCDDDHDHGATFADEHVWVSLSRVKVLCAAIAEALAQVDPCNAQTYMANLDAYIEKLTALDTEFHAMANAAENRTLVVADRFPFRYMMTDYNLTSYAAFAGCSAETEASFTTVLSLVQKINELELDFIIVTESSDKSIARTLINNSEARNQEILVMDSLQSVTTADVRNGVTFLSLMEKNLSVMREALS